MFEGANTNCFYEMSDQVKRARMQEWAPFLTNKDLGLAVESKDLGWASVALHQNMMELNRGMRGGFFDTTKFAEPGDMAVGLYGESAMPEAKREELVAESQGHAVGYSTTGITGDGVDTVGQMGKMIGVLIRRIFPKLVSKEFFGHQPISSNMGIIAALKAEYVGNGQRQIPVGRGRILVLDADVDNEANWAPDKTTTIDDYAAINLGHVTQANSGATGIVAYLEENMVLVHVANGSPDFVRNEAVSVGNGAAAGQNSHNVTQIFDSEAGHNRVFRNYGYGDYLPDWSAASGSSDNMPSMSGADVEVQEVGISLIKKSVKAQQKILKTSRPNSMAEDFKNNMGTDVNVELLNILEGELGIQMNQEFINYLNSIAMPLAKFDLDTGTDGRYSKEKLLGLYAKMRYESWQIHISSRAGFANRILMSPDVQVGLELLSNLWSETVNGDFRRGDTYCGVMGGFRAHVDTFARESYVTMALRGESQVQAGAYFCPYVMLDYGEATHPDHLFDKNMGFRSRYAYTDNPFGADAYFRRLPVEGLKKLGIG